MIRVLLARRRDDDPGRGPGNFHHPVLTGSPPGAEIIRAVPTAGVAILTTFGDDTHLARALDDGARGSLLKSGSPRELFAGIHAVAAGGAYLSPKIAARG